MTAPADRKVPQIRFKGFEGEWEELNVKGICSISTGKSNTQDRVEDGVYPFYVRSSIIERSNRFLYDEEAVLTVGDGVGTGKVYHYVNGKYDLHQRVYRMFDFVEGAHGKYFYYFFANNFYRRVMAMTAKTSVDSVRLEMIAEMEIQLPRKPEQSSIATFFSELDQLIGQHQRKHNKLVTLKKAMLQKMFPQPGSTTPEIRFKDFSGKWVEKRILELFQVTRGNVLAATKTSSKKTREAPFPVYSSQTKNNGLMGYYESYLFEDAITWTTDGANAGTVCYREGRFYSTNVNGVLLSDRGYANRAVAEALNREAWKHVSHVGNPKLMNNVMSQIKIFIPDTVNEQKQIGTYFRQLDELISKYATQLQKLKQLKSACLEKMFV